MLEKLTEVPVRASSMVGVGVGLRGLGVSAKTVKGVAGKRKR
jgi:hypothetical protein